jgi:RimJ/RimL family protein N-acetyltransferase
MRIGRADAECSAVELRPATLGDADLVFHWRNLPEIVALGTSGRAVERGEHEAWLRRVVEGDDSLLLIVVADGRPIGQVRFDWHDGWCSVSIYLLSGHTGRGLGVAALRAGCRRAIEHRPTERIVAFVRADNLRSISAFRKAGFRDGRPPGLELPAGHVALVRSLPSDS